MNVKIRVPSKFIVAVCIAFQLLVLGACEIGLLGTRLSPPEWIVGTWGSEKDQNSMTFTSDNLIMVQGNVTTDFMQDQRATDEIDKKIYTIVARHEGVDGDSRYIFEKIDDTRLSFSVRVNNEMRLANRLLYREDD